MSLDWKLFVFTQKPNKDGLDNCSGKKGLLQGWKQEDSVYYAEHKEANDCMLKRQLLSYCDYN